MGARVAWFGGSVRAEYGCVRTTQEDGNLSKTSACFAHFGAPRPPYHPAKKQSEKAGNASPNQPGHGRGNQRVGRATQANNRLQTHAPAAAGGCSSRPSRPSSISIPIVGQANHRCYCGVEGFTIQERGLQGCIPPTRDIWFEKKEKSLIIAPRIMDVGNDAANPGCRHTKYATVSDCGVDARVMRGVLLPSSPTPPLSRIVVKVEFVYIQNQPTAHLRVHVGSKLRTRARKRLSGSESDQPTRACHCFSFSPLKLSLQLSQVHTYGSQRVPPRRNPKSRLVNDIQVGLCLVDLACVKEENHKLMHDTYVIILLPKFRLTPLPFLRVRVKRGKWRIVGES